MISIQCGRSWFESASILSIYTPLALEMKGRYRYRYWNSLLKYITVVQDLNSFDKHNQVLSLKGVIGNPL